MEIVIRVISLLFFIGIGMIIGTLSMKMKIKKKKTVYLYLLL